jgi:hypothetical protein
VARNCIFVASTTPSPNRAHSSAHPSTPTLAFLFLSFSACLDVSPTSATPSRCNSHPPTPTHIPLPIPKRCFKTRPSRKNTFSAEDSSLRSLPREPPDPPILILRPRRSTNVFTMRPLAGLPSIQQRVPTRMLHINIKIRGRGGGETMHVRKLHEFHQRGHNALDT